MQKAYLCISLTICLSLSAADNNPANQSKLEDRNQQFNEKYLTIEVGSNGLAILRHDYGMEVQAKLSKKSTEEIARLLFEETTDALLKKR